MIGFWFSKFLSVCLGFVYPAYCSFKALKSPVKEDDTQWLTYWTVYGLWNVVEYFLDFLVCWLPLYYEFKILFVLWLQLPNLQGALYIYLKYMKPYLDTHDVSYQALIEDLKKNGSTYVKEFPVLAQSAMTKVQDMVKEFQHPSAAPVKKVE
eukprot:CAMPEP_0184646544 /NCGR_PEP_ID=MMETSP0308-20130426/3243_1 /TAXON_ID=38269 /ORGANISM="Gloeochaete witrockiana, Strain SAG 46.84" /LENGTH=151 /DNA_ID=CAMNT_0027076643 /DNA_START=187 /DNA_END=642 /DNA_ORIENTATION=-